MAKSEKPLVIERIFSAVFDDTTGTFRRTVVTSEDIVNAITWARKNHASSLSAKNPANFIKDIIRGRGASGMWPDSLKKLRITARQVTGDGNVFEFVPYAAGQEVPFPERFGYHAGVHRHKLQSVSMPLASKALGRDDETYLIQVAVKLLVVETHFALTSKLNVVELNHLQIGIKLRLVELDSLFAAFMDDERIVGGQKEKVRTRLVITAEAKKKGQAILEDQIIRQVIAAFQETDVDVVVPIAMTASGGGIYIAEFEAVTRAQLPQFKELTLSTEALYELVPPVKGI